MTKLRKRMILLKTSRVLKENQLILFFHDSNRTNVYNENIFSCLTPQAIIGAEDNFSTSKEPKNQQNQLLKVACGSPPFGPTFGGGQAKSLLKCELSSASKDERPRTKIPSDSHRFSSIGEKLLSFKPIIKQRKLQVKNKVAIKALRVIFFSFFQSESALPVKNKSDNICTVAAGNNLLYITEGKPHSKIDGFPDKVNALLQGTTVIIGMNSLSTAGYSDSFGCLRLPPFALPASEGGNPSEATLRRQRRSLAKRSEPYEATSPKSNASQRQMQVKLSEWKNKPFQPIGNFFEKNEGDKFLLMGGIYQTQLVNIKELKRLYNLGEEKIHYQKLITFLRINSLYFILRCFTLQSIHKHTFLLFSCLQSKSILLIYILKNYKSLKNR